jgi:fumarate hydratase class II
MSDTRVEIDSLGSVEVPADRLWGAQTQRSLEHFSIGDDLIPREMIPAYAIVKKVTWTPETEPALMRASLPARLGQEKPHETQAPHPRTDHPQAADR